MSVALVVNSSPYGAEEPYNALRLVPRPCSWMGSGLPGPMGSWAAVGPHAQRAGAVLPTQADAIARAKEIVDNAGGGEVGVHHPDGRIRDSITVPPANDPCPPRDER